MNKLRLQMVQLEEVLSHMAEMQASFASNNTGTVESHSISCNHLTGCETAHWHW